MLSICLAVLDAEDDKDLFRRLYEKYRQEMYAAAYGILHNKQDAEDAVHCAFERIAVHFDKIQSIPCQDLGPYIVMISRNTARNLYKSNQRRSSRNTILQEDTVVLDPDLLERTEYEALVGIICALPEIYKEVLMLRCLYGFKPKEIAAMQGITVGTFWKRFERAKKLLREALERGKDNAG